MDALLGFLFFISFIALIVGLIKPKWVIRWGEPTRKKALLTYGMAAIAFMVISAIFFPPETKIASNDVNKATLTTTTSVQGAAKSNTATTTKINKSIIEPSSIKTIETKVVRTIDGDTIEVELNGKIEKVRLIGVDTPETHHPTKPVEPYGMEAENYTRSQLDGKTIYLEMDVQERDKYGRILAYVWLSQPDKINDAEISTKMFNAHLLLDGYAQLLTIPPDVKYADYFTRYQSQAREQNKGLWSPLVTTTTTEKRILNNGGGDSTIVYIINTGEKYHQSWCRYLSKSKIPITLSEAKARGYTPCSMQPAKLI